MATLTELVRVIGDGPNAQVVLRHIETHSAPVPFGSPPKRVWYEINFYHKYAAILALLRGRAGL